MSMSMTHNLQQHERRILACRTRTQFFCSYTNKTLSSPVTNLTLHCRIEAALPGEIPTLLEQWRQQQQQHGKQLNPSLVRSILEKLHDSHRFREALEVSNWMIEQNICKLIPQDFTTRFHLIEKVLGFKEAEKFFESIPENQRSESIYNSLLRSYAKRSGKHDLDKAESIFKKMRELGLLLRLSPYSSMTSLYRPNPHENRDNVDEILKEMKENNIELDSITVNNVLRVYADVSDVKTMEKFLADWEGTTRRDGLTVLDMARAYLRTGSKEKARKFLRRTDELISPKSYEEFIRLYGEVGEREDVYRIWNLYNKSRNKDNEGFLVSIGSLLKLDDIKGAEEIYYKHWGCSALEFDIRIPTMLMSSYREKGMVEKADKLTNKIMGNARLVRPITPLLEELGEKGNEVKPSDLRDLIKTLCDSNQFSKALEASTWMGEKKLFNLFPQDYATRLYVIKNVLGLEEAEKFFERSIPKNMKDYHVYATLLSCYTRSNKTLDKAEAIFEKMSELGFLSTPFPLNSMICLYSRLGKRNKVDNLLMKVKEMNIELDNLAMNNVLRVYADETDINTMEKFKRECEDDKNQGLEMGTVEAVAKAYERAGLILEAIEITRSTNEVQRLWNEYKEKAKADQVKIDEENPWKTIGWISNEDNRRVISSLLKLNDVKGAEEIYGEWEPQGPLFDSRIPCLLISHYCEHGDEMKVREVVNSSIKKRKLMKFKMVKEDLSLFGTKCLGYSILAAMLWWAVLDPVAFLVFHKNIYG